MSAHRFAVIAAVCVCFLLARSVTQPSTGSFDEPEHVQTALDIRQRGGLPTAEEFPGIVYRPETSLVAYHYLPPAPYLFVAGTSVSFGVEATADGIRAWGRLLSSVALISAVVMAGIATTMLQGRTERRDWTAAAWVCVGLTLMPEFQSMGTAFTVDSFGVFLAALLLAALGWAGSTGWDLRSTGAVALVAAALVGTRTTSYPILLMVPALLAVAPMIGREKLARLTAIGAAVVAVNLWWWLRNYSISGDPLGAFAHSNFMLASGFAELSREYQLWYDPAAGFMRTLSLLIGSAWLWIQQSRMLLTAQTWRVSTAVIFWAILAVPVLGLGIRWVARYRHRQTTLAMALGTAAFIGAASLYFALRASAQFGAFAVGKYTFINLIPLGIVLGATLGSENSAGWRTARGAAMAFAASLDVVYLVAIVA